MYINIDKTGTIEGFNNILNNTLKDEKVKTILILSCDSNGFIPDSINNILKNIPLPIFGGIFPEIIYGNEKLDKGTIVAGLSTKANIQIISELSNKSIDYEKILDKKIPNIENAKTMFVFVDGFSQRISALIDSLFNLFGLEINYIGGGAGSLSMQQKPCLFTNNGLIQDSAILSLHNVECGIGVNHGWQKINGPYRVTDSDRNVIKSLNSIPAMEVYRKVVEEHSGRIFTEKNFFDISKGYPFGISKLGSEKVVRDPFLLGENNSLICVGEVPQGSFVDILTGNTESLVKATKKAFNLANQAYKGTIKPKTILLFDCISRVLFMEDNFNQELNVVFDKKIPLIGALTIGEIANSGKDYLEFYNKTSVVGVIEE